jgi:3-hydroxyisobutyrate dehydrogenase-like beta-hydroxyacid dehydrogenase
MTRVGFVGLGQMGAPMAGRLLDAGHELSVWNRTASKADSLVAQGARRARSPADAARGSDAIVTMLSWPETVENVVLGEDGVAVGVSPGAVLIEMSTIGPEMVARISDALPAEVEMVDAPVLGSTPEAEGGNLKIFVGADEESFVRLEELLRVLGDPIRIGPLGAGASAKLVVNSTLGLIQLAFGEALALAGALGLEETTVLDLLELSPIGPTVTKKRDFVETGLFPPNFKLSLAVKDMTLVIEAAAARSVVLHGAAAARAAFEAADRDGLGDCDYSAVAAHLSGRSVQV